MTISTTKNRINQAADGVQLIFIYDFIVLDAAHMFVYFDEVLQVGGYAVNGVGNNAGGDVTFVVAPTNGVVVTLQRIVPLTQAVDYLPYDPFPAETHEGALDKLTTITQQNSDAIERSVKAPITDDGLPNYTLPLPIALNAWRWDATGLVIENVDLLSIGIIPASDLVFKTGDNGSAKMPSGTTAQRDVAPLAGYMRHNTSFGRAEEYDGTSWKGLGGAGGAGGDDVFYENGQNVTTDYTITANKNAVSAGPITVDAGITVTVPAGSTWTVV